MRAPLLPALCLGVALLAATATAAPARPETEARALYQEAQRLERQGQLTEALARLRQAYELLPTPTLLLPMARLCEQLKQPLAGLEATRRLRRQVPDAGRAGPGGAAELDALEARLAAQVARLRVRTDVAGALVLIDGREVGRSPLDAPVELDPGVHEVEVRGARGARLPQVELGPGEEREAELRTAPPPQERAASAPARPPAELTARAPERAPPGAARYRPGAPTWIALGLGGAAVLAAGAVAISAGVLRANLAPRCDGALCFASGDASIAALNDEIARANGLSRATPVLLGVAGGAAAAAVIVGLVEWRVRIGREGAPRRAAAPGAAPSLAWEAR